MDRQELLEKVLAGYEDNYDITRRDPEAGTVPLAAEAVLHVSESGFVLVRKAQMWQADSDEYTYIFSVPELTDEIAGRSIQYAYDDGMSKIDLKSKKHHMCTRITALFLADSVTDDASRTVRKCNLYKSFQFSLKGWMEFHAAAADLGKGECTSNRYGKPTAEFVRAVLNPQQRKKGRGPLSMLKQMLD